MAEAAMNDSAGEVSAGAAFWRFSLSFYALPGVADALIALQDEGGFDVNLILFGLWLGHSGRGRIDGDELAAAERAIDSLRTGVVLPLRQLRRRLAAPLEADIAPLRDAIGELELAAERAVQERLACRAGAVNPAADPAARFADAQANLTLYLGADAAQQAEAAIVRRVLAAFSERVEGL
jgi:uncharacterized protein (TIGR02444 family)